MSGTNLLYLQLNYNPIVKGVISGLQIQIYLVIKYHEALSICFGVEHAPT